MPDNTFKTENYKTAVLIPCFNESMTVARVIKDFKRELPEADIYVYDNNSTDNTYQLSVENGAIVKKEYKQGKGNVVRSMFCDIDADVYLLIDGDDTYPAEFCHQLIELVKNSEADMAVGDRLSNGSYKSENSRPFHNFGNNLVKYIINLFFNAELNDIMSGYRCFNRKFVKTMPVLSTGFEIETEMTLHALDKRFIVREVPIQYRDRPEGSESKLNTFSDGIRVLKTIFMLFKDFKPLTFFPIASLLLFLISLICGVPVIYDYYVYQYIYHVPLAILATGLAVISALMLICGIILDTVVKNHRYLYELHLNNYIELENKKKNRKP